MSHQYLPLEDVQNRVRASFPGITYPADLGQLADTFRFGERGLTVNFTLPPGIDNPGDVVLTKQGFTSLVSDRLGLPMAVFNDKAISHDTKLALIKDKTAAMVGDNRSVYFKTRNYGGTVVAEAVMGRSYAQIDNFDVIDAVVDLWRQGLLPADTVAETFYISPDGRFMTLRLVSRQGWAWDIVDGPFYGVAIIQNDEFGEKSFSASVGLLRRACENLAIGEAVASAEHRWDGRANFINILRDGFNAIDSGHDFMKNRMAQAAAIRVDYPGDMLEKVLSDLKIRNKRVLQAANDYLERENGNTVYHIIQAVTAATQEITKTGPKRQLPLWADRNRIEASVWGDVAVNLVNYHLDGGDINETYMDETLSLRDYLAKHLRHKAGGFQGQTAQVLTEAADEVLVIDIPKN